MSAPTPSLARTCCITGTGGYLGGCLVRHFKQRGWRVVELNRSGTILAGGDEARSHRLGDPFPGSLEAPSLLVHAAYDFTPLAWEEIHARNVLGAELLFASARTAGTGRILHISSMSAYPGCRSLYGRAKLLAEAHAARHGGISLRPGLIHDESQPGGMVGKLRSLVSLSPVIPIPGRGRNVLYFTHQEDLCRVVGYYGEGGDWGSESVLTAANPTPWMFRDILKELARRQNRPLLCIPTPWQMSWMALKLAEISGDNLPLKSDSLISLLNQNPSFDYNAKIISEFREF